MSTGMTSAEGAGKGSRPGRWIPVIVVVAIVVVAAIALFGWYISGYNRAVRLEQAAKEQWSNIDAMIERRFDLIPNLVETVKGYTKHEAEVLEHLADARGKYRAAPTVGEKAGIADAFARSLTAEIVAVAENYPQLKANENFLKLQDELAGTENRIAVQRVRYNAAVAELNTYCRSFFGGFFARQAGVAMSNYIELPEGKGEVPKVKF